MRARALFPLFPQTKVAVSSASCGKAHKHKAKRKHKRHANPGAAHR